MERNGCIEGFATDLAFLRTPVDGICGTNLNTYFGFIGSMACLRLIAILKRILNVRSRQTNNSLIHNRGLRIHLLQLFLDLLVFILIGVNVATVHNGISFMLISLSYLPLACIQTLSLIKFVRLSKKLIPRALLNNNNNGVQEEEVNKLQFFSKIGQVLFVINVISLIGTSMALIIFTPIYPTADFVLGILGWALKASFQFTVSVGFIHQIYRCVNVIQKVMESNKEITSASEKNEKLQKVVRNLKVRAYFSLLFNLGIATTFFLLLTISVIPWTATAVLGGMIFLETLGALFNEFYIEHVRKRKKMVTDEITAQDKKNQQQQQQHGGAVTAAVMIVRLDTPSGAVDGKEQQEEKLKSSNSHQENHQQQEQFLNVIDYENNNTMDTKTLSTVQQ